MMKRRTWLIHGLLGLLAIGLGQAEAGVIPPVDGSGNPIAAAVTLSIFLGGSNVTDTWLPEPGQSVTLVVNGVPAETPISLVCPNGELTTNTSTTACTQVASVVTDPTKTSNRRGVCTNSGLSTDLLPDFGLTVTATGAVQLTPTDCLGRAVIQVTVGGATHTIVAPKDTDHDGIPDIYEDKFCPLANPALTDVTCLSPSEDIDIGPGTNPLMGDGFPNIDEARGFIVSVVDVTPGFVFTDGDGIQKKHIRTHPRQKDIFAHLVNPQCLPVAVDPLTSTAGFLGGGAVVYPFALTQTTTITPSATSGNAVTLTAGAAVFRNAHVGGEIVVTGGSSAGARARIIAFTSQTVVTAEVTVPFASTASVPSGSWTLSESLFANLSALIAPGQIHPIGFRLGLQNYTTDQWGDTFIRLSMDAFNLPVFEFAADPGGVDRQMNLNSVGTPPQRGLRIIECLDTQFADPVGSSSWAPLTSGEDNAIVHTQRLVNFVNSGIAAGGNRALRVQTLVGRSWTTIFTGSSPPMDADKHFVRFKVIQFYIGMEGCHSLKLNKNLGSYGPHNAPGTGDNCDAAIVTKVDNSPSGFNTFRIPSFFNSAGQADFLHN